MGASFGRLISECLVPIVRRTLELMDEMGIIELPLKIDGLQVKIVPVSPLAMASNKDKVNDVLTFLQLSQQLGAVGGSLLKMDKVGDYLADMLGVPSSLRTTDEERQQIMEQTMQLAQKQMKMQQGQMPQEQPQEQPVG